MIGKIIKLPTRFPAQTKRIVGIVERVVPIVIALSTGTNTGETVNEKVSEIIENVNKTPPITSLEPSKDPTTLNVISKVANYCVEAPIRVIYNGYIGAFVGVWNGLLLKSGTAVKAQNGANILFCMVVNPDKTLGIQTSPQFASYIKANIGKCVITGITIYIIYRMTKVIIKMIIKHTPKLIKYKSTDTETKTDEPNLPYNQTKTVTGKSNKRRKAGT